MNDLSPVYLSIFDLKSEDVSLLKVKRVGKTNVGFGNSYKFLGIVSAPSKFNGEVSPTDSEMIVLRNDAQRRYKDVGVVDFKTEVSWVVKKKGKKKRKRFVFAGYLSPQTVLDFEIVDGNFYILCELYGVFY